MTGITSCTRDEIGNLIPIKLLSETASGSTLCIGLFLNYRFQFEAKEHKVRVTGYHDGYPSYKILRNGKTIYYQKT